MRAFRSVWRRQIRPVSVAPSIEILMSSGADKFISLGAMLEKRMAPYPPNLSKILARIIEPAVGASTWALGSHR